MSWWEDVPGWERLPVAFGWLLCFLMIFTTVVSRVLGSFGNSARAIASAVALVASVANTDSMAAMALASLVSCSRAAFLVLWARQVAALI